MKLTFIFMSICLAVSHQQYHLPRIFALPWMPQFIQQPTYSKDYFQVNRRFNYFDDSSVNQVVSRLDSPADFGSPVIVLNKDEGGNNFPNVQSRIKGFGNQRTPSSSQEQQGNDVQPRIKLLGNRQPSVSSQEQQNARFFINLGGRSSAVNPLLKTVTFTLTSTCTSYSVVTCVPRDFVLGAPPAALVVCARKREIGLDELPGDNSQFPVVPTTTQLVEPTTHQKWPAITRDSRQTRTSHIVSSKEERSIRETNKDLHAEKLLRKGRFYYLWQSFATGTTVTSWQIISSTKILKSIPLDAAGALAVLPCLPAGVSICS